MTSTWVNLPLVAGGGSWKAPVDTAVDLPTSGNTIGDARVAQDSSIIYVWSGSVWLSAGGGTGAVTSVGISDFTNLFNISNSPVTTFGNINLASYKSQAQNTFLGGPSGGAGAAAFRLLVASDIPALSYVSSVGGTAPIASSGGTAPSISISLAGAGSDGYLSSANWNTFNNKQPAGNYITALTADATASGPGSAALTLATVNATVGTFGVADKVSTVTVNGKGLVTNVIETSIAIAQSQVSSLVSDLAGKQATGSYITSLTSDVTAAGPGAAAATIATNVVTNAKLAQMPTLTIKGNNTGGTANALDLTASQVNTVLGNVTTMGAFGSTPNSNGASISGNTLTLQPADATNGGGVSTTTQTLAGNKTLTGTLSVQGTTAIASNAASIATIGGASSTAIHQVNGALKFTTRTITGNLTIDTTTTDYIILCNQSAAISVTLPAPTNGRSVIIKDISGTASTNNITVIRNGSEKIENIAASKVFQSAFGSWLLVADGTNWWMG